MGFTLIELLLVFGIFIILTSIGISFAVDFFNNRNLDEATNYLISLLREAQNRAMAVEDDSSFGVFVSSLNFVLFKGDDYLSRDPSFDFIIQAPNNLNINGPNEIVFSKLTGLPNVVGNIVLSCSSQSNTIEVNDIGRINLQ